MLRIFLLIAVAVLGFTQFPGQTALSQEAKQTVFGGVKLGTRADALGFKVDEDRPWYEYKNKYFLTGDFNQKGHPINQIQLNCSSASDKDQLNGISCKNKVADILNRFGNAILPRCATDEPMSWDDFSKPNIYYNQETNQFWSINTTNGDIFSFGIASNFSEEHFDCLKEFSLDDILKIRINQNAKIALKNNFGGYSGRSFLNAYTEIRYHTVDVNFPIYKISFQCKNSGEIPKYKISGFGCGNTPNEISSSLGSAVEKKCYPPFNGSQRFAAYFNPKTGEYWDASSEDEKIYSFGYLDKADEYWVSCVNAKEVAAKIASIEPETLWEKISETEDTAIYLDRKNIIKKSSEVRFWVYYKYLNLRCMAYCDAYAHSPEKVNSGKFFEGINCKEDQYRILGYEYFQILGSTRITYDSNDIVGEWRSILKPDDVLLRDKVCN